MRATNRTPSESGSLLTRLLPFLLLASAWLGAFLLAVTYWDFRTDNGLYKLITLADPGKRDGDKFVSLALPVMAVILGLIHGGAFLLARLRKEEQKPLHFEMARAAWPGMLALPIVVAAFIPFRNEIVLILLFAPVFGLTIGNVIRRLLELWGSDGAIAPEPSGPRYQLAWLGAVSAAVLLYIAWFSYLSVVRHASFGSALHDLSIYDQLMWNTLHGRPLECGMFNSELMGYELAKYNNNFFAEHFIPTFWIVAPFYWLFPSTSTVLVAQTVILGLIAIPAFLIALKKLRSPAIAFFFAITCLISPIVQQSNMKDVHMDAFAPFFLLAAVAAYLWGRRVWYWVLILLALGCKEEIAINVAGLGAFLFFAERDRKIGSLTIAAGLAWFFLVVGFVMPAFRGGEHVRQMYRYAHVMPPDSYESIYDVTPGMLVKSLIFHPVYAFRQVASIGKLPGLLALTAPFAFFVFWTRWAAWLWILPVSALTLLSGFLYQAELHGWYGSPLLPSVLVASIYGAARWLGTLDDREALPARAAVAGVAIALLIPICSIGYELGFQPGGKRYHASDYEVLDHDRLALAIIEEIPGDAIVSAQITLGAHMAHRRFIYMFPAVFDAEYIFLDTRSFCWPIEMEEFRRQVEELLESPDWGLVRPYEDGFLVFKKGYPTDLNKTVSAKDLDFSAYRDRRYGL